VARRQIGRKEGRQNGDIPMTSSCVGNNPLTRLSNSAPCHQPTSHGRQHDSSLPVDPHSAHSLPVAYSRNTDSTSVIPGAMACVLRGAEGSRGEKILWKDMQCARVGWDEGEMNGSSAGERVDGPGRCERQAATMMGHVIDRGREHLPLVDRVPPS
jgi:hypothetical protein